MELTNQFEEQARQGHEAHVELARVTRIQHIMAHEQVQDQISCASGSTLEQCTYCINYMYIYTEREDHAYTEMDE